VVGPALIHIPISQVVNGEEAWTAGGTSLFKVVKCKLPARSCKKKSHEPGQWNSRWNSVWI